MGNIRKTIHFIFLFLMALDMCIFFSACSQKGAEISSAKENLYAKNGETVGVGRNIDTDIEVKLSIKDEKIVDVDFKDNIEPNKKSNMQKMYAYAKDQILSKNSVNIDAISGSTSSTRAISYAARLALINGNFDLSKFDSNENEDKTHINDGIYEGISNGMNGVISVQVEVSDKKIKSVKVSSHNETPGIGDSLRDKDGKEILYGGESPITKIPRLIVENQSVNVDTISGATVTSEGIMMATSYALKEAGATQKDFIAIKKEKTSVQDMTTDVLVVGAGGAGLASAISAAENGAKVLIVEKNGQVGGDTLVCGAIYNTPDEDLQSKVSANDTVNKVIVSAIEEKDVSDAHRELKEKVVKQYDEYKKSNKKTLFDSKEWFTLQTWNGGDKVAKLNLVKVLCEKAYDGYEWIKNLGVEFDNYISQGAGSLWQRTHTSTMEMGTGFISTYVRNIEKNKNIDLLLSTECTKLLYDGEKIIGAECTNRYGDTFTVRCKSVILATGGFSANVDMINKYNTSGKWPDLTYVKTTNRRTVSNGDGIKLATDIGAGLTDMEQIQLLYLSEIENGHLVKYPPRCISNVDQIIFINKNGERFVNEGARRDEICLAINNQPDSMFYMLESGDGVDYKDINDPNWKSADGFTFDYLEKNKYIVVADTISELAEKLDMNQEVLEKTIEDFNKSADSGDDKYDRTLYSTKLTKGPYVATKRITAIHHTMGGLSIDENANVLDEKEECIKGLYACGEVTGGIHGANRLGGNAVVDTVVFGRIAGKSAAGN